MIRTGKKFSKPDLSRVINGDTLSLAEQRQAKAPDVPEKVRLDLLLLRQFPEYNRSSLQTFIASGFVKVNSRLAQKPNQKFLPDAKLELNVPSKQALATPPRVIYEDDRVLVLDKPAGLLSMAKGEYCPETTLEDFGLLVHRLDRDTSGVVILAKDPTTQAFLRRQFQERKTHKTYVAVVWGRPKLPEAKIDLPIARNLNRPTTFRVDPAGKTAVTFYRTLASSEHLSLLELKPETGRTHQLRVHLAYLGTPILGDPVYGHTPTHVRPTAMSGTGIDLAHPPRLFLHARSLEITIPGPDGNQRLTFDSPTPASFLAPFGLSSEQGLRRDSEQGSN